MNITLVIKNLFKTSYNALPFSIDNTKAKHAHMTWYTDKSVLDTDPEDRQAGKVSNKKS